MSDLDDQYRRKEKQKQAKEAALSHLSEDRYADIVNEICRRIAAEIRANPPATCQWTVLDGESRASWRVYTQNMLEVDDHIRILADGRLVDVRYQSGQDIGVVKTIARFDDRTISPAEIQFASQCLPANITLFEHLVRYDQFDIVLDRSWLQETPDLIKYATEHKPRSLYSKIRFGTHDRFAYKRALRYNE